MIQIVKFVFLLMKQITQNNNKLNFFGREGESLITGKIYGELFGLSFNKEQTNILNILQNLEQQFKDKKITRFLTWELYRIINNIDINQHKIINHFIEINDFTDDFDFPKDYDIWYEKIKPYLLSNGLVNI